MTTTAVLEAARAAGITLARAGGRLRCEGPTEALTPQLLALLAEHKPALLALPVDPGRALDYAAHWRDELNRLHSAGEVARLLGDHHAARAARLLARAEADLLGACEPMRQLVHDTMRRAWAGRGFTDPEGPTVA